MYNIKNSEDLKAACKAYMAERDLPLDIELNANGQIHRYSASSRNNKKSEWYVGYEGVSSQGNHFLNAVFGSWKGNAKYIYRSFDSDDSFSDDERAELKEIARLNMLKADCEIKEKQDKTAENAKRIWNKCSIIAPTEEHLRYMRSKGVNPTKGVRFGTSPQGRPSIVIPLCNAHDELRSLQFISADNTGKSFKSFLLGGEKRGNYHLIGDWSDDENVIFISEGYATGVTTYEAIQKPTVVAFDANNISSVIENLRKKFPQRIVIIAADDDDKGKEKAQEAVNKFSYCSFVIPEFSSSRNEEDTDFNDLASIAGIEEVRNQLARAYAKSEAGKRAAREWFLGSSDPCKKFKLKELPPELRDYIWAIHKTTSAHPIMITASVLSMISAYLGTKVFIPEGEYFQTLYANLWILCIAKSGQFKTTALNKGAKISYDQQARVFAAIKEMRANILEGDNIAELEKNVLNKSRENVVLPTKITAEAFLEHLAQGHEGVIFASEFGGWLQNFDKSHNNDFKPIMTEFYDVPAYYRYKTKTQGDCILETPYVSICGVSTMPWVKSNIKPTDVPSGFFARFIIYTPPSEDMIPPALPSVQLETEEDREIAFKSYLDHVLTCVGNERSFTLTDEARRIFHSYHAFIYCVPHACSDSVAEQIQPYLKRWSPALLKIAMIMQLFIDPKSKEISGDAIFKAFHVLSPAIKSTIALFEGELGESHHQRKCRTLLDWITKRIKDKKIVTRQAILSSKQLDGGSAEYDPVLKDLIEQGRLVYKPGKTRNESQYAVVAETENS